MTDVLTTEQRRRNMQAIRGRDTHPEIVVRRLAHSMGFRYRLHRRDMPGKPDLVFSSRHSLIFVHGCFWHMHRCAFGRVRPATNAGFWALKRAANVARDRRNHRKLRRQGWRILTVWECQTKRDKLEVLKRRLRRFLGEGGTPCLDVREGTR